MEDGELTSTKLMMISTIALFFWLVVLILWHSGISSTSLQGSGLMVLGSVDTQNMMSSLDVCCLCRVKMPESLLPEQVNGTVPVKGDSISKVNHTNPKWIILLKSTLE